MVSSVFMDKHRWPESIRKDAQVSCNLRVNIKTRYQFSHWSRVKRIMSLIGWCMEKGEV